ncbi:hypothetical protein ACFLTE_00240 [Bacteroidota bacterium]
MKNKIKTIVVAVLISNNILFAQTVSNDNLITRPVQITFISPMGTNGIESGKVINNFSLNMFAGVSGGLNGAEIGGFSNVIKNDAIGFQVAGFSNTVLGETNAVQIAGFVNVSKNKTRGAQLAGFSNVVVADFTGAQISGFSNTVKQNSEGVQIAGFSNVSTDELEGVQISGFANTVKGNSKGVQVAGFSNVSTGNLEGAQISGFVNKADNVVGTQIGFINVCENIEKGASIGFLSIVKNGYHAFEIGVTESSFTHANLKTGSDHFYNIFSIGVKPDSEEWIWGVGYGVGTIFSIN